MEVLATDIKLSPYRDDEKIPENTVFIKQEYYEDDNPQDNYSSYDVSKVKQEDSSDCDNPISDPLDNSVKDNPYDIENHFLVGSNLERFPTDIDDLKSVQKGILPTEEHPANRNTIVNASTNSSLSERVEETAYHNDYNRAVTMDQNSYTCHVCDMAFSNPSHLVTHERFHTVEKPYICDECPKAFNALSHFVIHKRTHTGEKPFVCHVCQKKYSKSSNLTSHMRSHTGEKPYVCDVCQKPFNRSSHLVEHKRSHTGDKPYECSVCQKKCSTSSNLWRHKRTHTGERPYVCDVCQMAFGASYHLVRHNLTHSGEKPYGCDLCDKRCSTASNLMSHKRVHMAQ